MSGQFDKETSNQNFEWHRQRALKEKKKQGSQEGLNRIVYNVKAIAKKHGQKAANEILRELDSR